MRLKGWPAVVAATLLAAACGQPASQDVHSAVAAGRNGAEVTFDATLVDDPAVSGGHERFHVTDAQGDQLEVDHNVSLAAAVPAHRGDHVVIHGRLYLDPGRAGVHCTHAHTSSGCPEPGYIGFNGQTYS